MVSTVSLTPSDARNDERQYAGRKGINIVFFTYPPNDRNPLEGLLEHNVHVSVRVHEVRKAPRIPGVKCVSEQTKTPEKGLD